MSDQLTLFDARASRDAALERVRNNAGSWTAQAMHGIRQHVPPGWTGSGEAIRLLLFKGGLPRPHHHNAWGAVIRLAVAKRLLRPTGQYTHMLTEKSHARKTPVYVRQ
jgi:hypothetical protein